MDARFVPTITGMALVTLLAACGNATSPTSGTFNPSGTSGSPAPPVTSPSPVVAAPSTLAIGQLKESVLTRYRAYQKAYETAYKTNNAAGLSAVAMNPLLGRVTKDVEKTVASGENWRFHNVLNPQIQSRSKDSTTIVVIDCVTTLGSFKFDAATGKRLRSYGSGAFLYQAIMKYTEGTWKISDGIQGKKC